MVHGSFSINSERRRIIMWPSAACNPAEGRDPMTRGNATGDTSPRWRWEGVAGKLPLCPQLRHCRPTICHHFSRSGDTPGSEARSVKPQLYKATGKWAPTRYLTFWLPQTIKAFNSERKCMLRIAQWCGVQIFALWKSFTIFDKLFGITLSYPVTRHKKTAMS